MSEYKKYPKIHRLGKEETDGILEHNVIIQEKIDGANCSIFLLDGEVRCGTKTRMLPEDESFRGLTEAVKANPNLKTWLLANEDHVLYGEWLVRHTLAYPETVYGKIYLFDIYDTTEKRFYSQASVQEVAGVLGLEYPHVFAEGVMTEEQIKEFVGKSNIAPAGEGVVLKALDFVNKFGDLSYAKLVTQKFTEDNATVFGGNNKHSETYWEMYIVNKYCTLARVQKIMQKLQSELDRRLDMEHIPRIAQTCYHDMITEEIWEIQSKVPIVNFKELKRLSNKKFIQIYKDILTNSLSVADAMEEHETKTIST